MERENNNFVDRPIFKKIGWLCTVASLFAAVYAFYYRTSPLFEYEIISKIQILNKNVDIASIHIMIDSLDIQQDSMNVSIVEIKISNNGREHIRREDYDDSQFGLEIINGELLETPEFSKYSSSHIQRCCQQHIFNAGKSFIPIPIIPLDSQDYYYLKLVILHHSYMNISFIPIGKIIGQKEIFVLENKNTDEPLWKKVFDENIIVHILRLGVYLIIIIAIFWLVFYSKDKIEEFKCKKMKNSFIKELRKDKRIDDEVINDFLILDFPTFDDIVYLIKFSEVELHNKYKASINYMKNEKNKANEEQWSIHSKRNSTIKLMFEKEYMKLTDSVLVVNQKKKTSLLRIKEKLYKSEYYNNYLVNGFIFNQTSNNGILQNTNGL